MKGDLSEFPFPSTTFEVLKDSTGTAKEVIIKENF